MVIKIDFLIDINGDLVFERKEISTSKCNIRFLITENPNSINISFNIKSQTNSLCLVTNNHQEELLQQFIIHYKTSIGEIINTNIGSKMELIKHLNIQDENTFKICKKHIEEILIKMNLNGYIVKVEPLIEITPVYIQGISVKIYNENDELFFEDTIRS